MYNISKEEMHNLFKDVKPKIEAMVNKAFITFSKEKDKIIEDILQEGISIYLDYIQKPQNQGKKNNPSGLFYTICKRRFQKKLEKENKMLPEDIADFENSIGDIDITEWEELEANRLNAKIVHQCLEKLKDNHQDMMKLRYWEDLPYKLIAEKLGFKSAAVTEMTMRRTIKSLKDCVSQSLEIRLQFE